MPKLLIVDDDPKLRKYLARGLGESGYDTRTAEDGEAALAMLREAPADIVLLDVMMPGMDGLEVMTAMRAEGIDAPVIFVTARDALDERISGLRLGGDDYVVKPFDLSELLARIEAVLRRGVRSLVSRVGDLEIDHRQGIITRAGQVLDLTRIEQGLLRSLAEASGRAVSRSDLLAAVWGIGFDPGTNVVDVHIRRLRQKLDAPFDRPLVHTVRGQGYALEDRG